jgi:ubiquinone/menaquinone biosynthesis C-methylase UbiE
MGPLLDHEATELARRRSNRIAPLYDFFNAPMELRARRWRRDLWSRLRGPRVLELGVGTGRNLPFYPRGAQVTAIDISERMLAKAAERVRRAGVAVRLEIADAQHLPYTSGSFDSVVATFLFCSVPDPIAGLAEARRVLRPGGQLLLLEHVLSRRPLLRHLMRWLDPIPFHLWGAHIDRDTVESVATAGFVIAHERDLALDIVKHVEAVTPESG